MRRLVISSFLVGGVALAPSLGSAETLTVLTAPMMPYAIEKGDRPGAAVEVMREMAKRAGVEVDVKFMPWARAQTEAQSGKAVAILPLTRTPEREPKYAWVAPLLSDPMYLQTTRKDVDISTLEKAKASTVAVQRSTPGEEDLKKAGVAKIESTSDEDTGAKMLKAGRVDAWYARGMVASATYAKQGGDPKELVRGAETQTPPMYLGGSPDFPKDLAEKLNKAIDSMKADGSYERIVRSYR